GRENAQGLLADREDRAVAGRRPRQLSARHLQGAGDRQMKVVLAALSVLTWSLATSAAAQSVNPPQAPQPPLSLLQPETAPGPPLVLTRRDALERAKQNDVQLQTAVSDADSAREDRVQAKAALLPAVSGTTQYIGNQPNGVNPNGRFVRSEEHTSELQS